MLFALAFTKVRSTVPLALRRAILFRVCHPRKEKVHPIRIFPSDCIFIARTCVPVVIFALKVASSVPSVLRRAIRLRPTPHTVVKVHQIRIFPSD